MKTIGRLLIILGMSATMLTSCYLDIHFGDFDLKYEYETEWAAAYYYGYSPEEEAVKYRLELILGRTDDENNLTSFGSKASLVLTAPEQDHIDLPEGTYGSRSNYNLSCGDDTDPVDPDTTEYSYVEMVVPGTGEMACYPVESGTVRVEVRADGSYEITAELSAADCQLEYEYEGPMVTYDLSDLKF